MSVAATTGPTPGTVCSRRRSATSSASPAISAAIRASTLTMRRSSTATRLRMSARASASAVCWSRVTSCFRSSTSCGVASPAPGGRDATPPAVWPALEADRRRAREAYRHSPVGLSDHPPRAGKVARPARSRSAEADLCRLQCFPQEAVIPPLASKMIQALSLAHAAARRRAAAGASTMASASPIPPAGARRSVRVLPMRRGDGRSKRTVIWTARRGYAGRMEVIEGRTGRRLRSEAERGRIAAESLAPGARVVDVARRHGVTEEAGRGHAGGPGGGDGRRPDAGRADLLGPLRSAGSVRGADER